MADSRNSGILERHMRSLMTASLHSNIPELRPIGQGGSSRVHSPDCLALLNACGNAIRGILNDLYVRARNKLGPRHPLTSFRGRNAGGKSVMSGYYLYCLAHTWMMDTRLVCVEPSPCLTNPRAGGSNGSVPGWGLILGPSVTVRSPSSVSAFAETWFAAHLLGKHAYNEFLC
jgi:hypothetical protein